jgi:hypothetical protein
MNARRLIALLFLGCLVSTAHAGQRASSCGIVLVGGLLIDGNGGVPIENSVVVIEGTRISAVGTTATVKRRGHRFLPNRTSRRSCSVLRRS